MSSAAWGSGVDTGTRAWNIVDATAPPERLATLRALTCGFALVYLAVRLPVFLQLRERRRGFDGVGVASVLSGPLPSLAVPLILIATFVSGFAALAGWWYRWSGPAFAVGVLVLTSYRGSWGQLLHFENLVTLHLLVVALAPAADRWSLDARRRRRAGAVSERDGVAYGWPIALAALVVVTTYVIAGIAKLRYGGSEWVFGDSMRNHVAYAAARNEVLGAPAAPLAGSLVRLDALWPWVAAATLVIELGAPIALFGGRMRTVWVIAAWTMHVGILLTMRIGFPYPLFLVAFAPFFRVELAVGRISQRLGLDARRRPATWSTSAPAGGQTGRHE